MSTEANKNHVNEQEQLLQSLFSALEDKIDQLNKNITQQHAELKDRLDNVEQRLQSAEKRQKKLKKRLAASQKNMEERIDKLDWRLQAKESFPSYPFATLPEQRRVVTQGSVSKPKFGKRSIFG